MVGGNRKPGRGRARRKAAGETPASEAVIEATPDAPPAGKTPFGGRGASPEAGPGAGAGGRGGVGTRWLAGLSGMFSPGIWAIAGIALAGAAALAYVTQTAREADLESSALLARIDGLEKRLERVAATDHAAAIAEMRSRLAALEQGLAGIEAGWDDALEEALAKAAANSAAAAPPPDPELAARIGQLEQALAESRSLADDRKPEAGQGGTAGQGGAETDGAEADGAGASDPWWGFFGRLLKVSRVDGG